MFFLKIHVYMLNKCQNLTLGLFKTVSKETFLFAKERMRIIETAIIFYVKKSKKMLCFVF